jgi:hypothetical protein
MNQTPAVTVTKTVLYASAAAIAAFLVGCTSTPQHTNVLVFGTNTKVALDLSQDATNGIGITLGYKRMEAVWMPLLPNQANPNGTGLQPSPCMTEKECPKFVGMDSADQYDTYSVLASFGSKLGAGVDSTGKDAKVNGEIAQYFATGLAARLLAQSGGAGLVSTQTQPLTAAQTVAVNKIAEVAKTEQDRVIAAVQDDKDAALIDTKKLTDLIAKATGTNAISAGGKGHFENSRKVAELRQWLVIHDQDASRLALIASNK